jgi:hypothetical protein
MSANRKLLFAIVAVALSIVPQISFAAQRDAGAKARGEHGGTFWSSKSAARSVQHARDYSRGAHEYVQSAPKPSAPYLRAEAAEISKNLEDAKAEVDYLKKNTASDKELAAALASIEKHLAAAHTEHHAFRAECAKDSVDSKVAMDCCSSLSDHLGKAHEELVALQKKLAPKPATPKE